MAWAKTRGRLADVALAALVIAVDAGGSLLIHWAKRAGGDSRLDPFGIMILVAGGAALLARRRYPTAVLALVLVTTESARALGAKIVWLGLIVAFFSAVLRGRRLAAILSLVACYGVELWHATAVFALALLAGLVALVAVAEVSRAWNARAVADRRGREETAARRVTQERLAIARDLHDVVAHSISVINVQAGTALHLMDRQPDRAREALTAIREVSGQALAELGAVLGTLREGHAPLAPAPTVARLDELAARARAAGFTVDLASEGEARPLPAGVDAATYRIVQEALTNAVRHSGGRTVRVLLRYEPDAVQVEVTDDGASQGTGTGPGSGNGLPGMSERARALGGTFHAGPRPRGGFGVIARLPA